MIEIAVLAAAVMASCGVYGLLTRRNVAFAVLSLELVFNAGILLLVVFLPLFRPTSEVASWILILLAVGAAEIAFGFAIAVALARIYRISDTLNLSELGGKIDRD